MTSTPDNVEYKGTCHCGRFQFKLHLFRPLEAVHACHCTLCAKKGYLWLFPAEQEFQVTRGAGELVCYDSGNDGHEKHMVTLHGDENLTEYRFGRGFTGHQFCKICGVQLSMKLHGPPQSVVDNLPLEKQEIVKQKLVIVPIRVAVLDGVELADLKIERTDEGTEGGE
ncbi:hypothetical protein AtubIFM55763_008860 [Aspergillus tubingensis]|nr:hypothetical protein AtubIFM55763_008860 [Aspergillus tubingensis]GLB00305.1 hypothetical protein AtubIFM57143_009353 [Aspergillus tubingensis]GLB16469.1 hypothetical protein AtubIFM61612_006318 [Aspergillus tubingensis]